MEEKIFHLPAVAAELNQIVEARLHTDGLTNIERILALQEQLTGSRANPFYVLIEPTSMQILARFAGATRDERRFIDFLRSR